LTLLDTNVVIDYLEGVPMVASRVLRDPRNELALPTIVVYELEYRTLRSRVGTRRRQELEEGLAYIGHVPFDSQAA